MSKNFIINSNQELGEGEIDLKDILKLIKCGSGSSVALKKQKVQKL